MRGKRTAFHNDIHQCVEQAHELARRFTHTRRCDQRLCQAFASLAGDEKVGLLAYVIWRGRSGLLSSLRSEGSSRYDGGAAGASHAQT